MEQKPYLAMGCTFSFDWLFFIQFTVAVTFSTMAIIFLFVRARLASAVYTEQPVTITAENLKALRSDRLFQNKIRTNGAYRYIGAKGRQKEEANYVSSLDLLPIPELFAHKDDLTRIFRNLVLRKLVVNQKATAFKMSNRFNTRFLINEVPGVHVLKVGLSLVAPFIVLILLYFYNNSSLPHYFDDFEFCSSRGMDPKFIHAPTMLYVVSTLCAIAGVFVYYRNSIFHSAK